MSVPQSWTTPDVRPVVELPAGRWVLRILEVLTDEGLRRHVLRGQVGPVSDKVLTAALRRLVESGLVERTLVAGVPAEVNCSLTPLAHTLWEPLDGLALWSRHHGIAADRVNGDKNIV